MDMPILLLAVVGLGITGYLSAIALFGASPAFCAEGSGCDVVQQSRWSVFLGLPIALWGFGLYALIAVVAATGVPGLRRWRRLWYLSALGLAISVYLTIVGYVSLDAFCAWCLASLATLAALFVIVTLRRPAAAPGMPWSYWGANTAVVVVVLVGMMHAWYSGLLEPRADPRLDALAVHLSETGVRYYGAFWCGTCQEQNRLFGAAADRLPYVECTPEGRGGIVAMECIRRDVRGYPTWIIGERRYEQVLTPRELALYSGFDWDAWQ